MIEKEIVVIKELFDRTRCDDYNIIRGPEDQVDNLTNLLINWINTESDIRNTFEPLQLGHIMQQAGFDCTDNDCEEYIDNIGDFQDKECCCPILLVTTTANKPMYKMWHFILDKYAPDCEYTYGSIDLNKILIPDTPIDFKIDTTNADEELAKSLDLTPHDIEYFSTEQFVEWGTEVFHLDSTNASVDHIKELLNEKIEKENLPLVFYSFKYVSAQNEDKENEEEYNE